MKPQDQRGRSRGRAIVGCLLACALENAVHAQATSDRTPETKRAVASVRSKDGSSIAYEKSGSGPALVIVSNALSVRSDFRRLATLLGPSFTVYNYDRRGRGDSGDTQPFAVDREIEDLAAVIERAGGSASLFGGSSGAVLALEAANRLGAKVKGAVLFEPPFIVDDSRPPVPETLFQDIGNLVAEGRRGDAVAQFMVKGVGVPEAVVAQMRLAPMWAPMEKRAHTLPYDGALLAGLQAGKPLPTGRWTSVKARTLLLDGDQSPPFLRNATKALAGVLPGATHRTLPGRDHSAMFMAQDAFVPVLVEFLLGSGTRGPGEREATSRPSR
jgi:pimeloyl-ACP methyl ester carboxylesterase